MQNFTTDNILAYLYDDESVNQARTDMDKSIGENWALQQKRRVLQESIDFLNETPLQEPDHRTVEAILQYAELSIHVS